jgi:hypothetical protein
MLIRCTECGQEISDSAAVCPHCGYHHTRPVLSPVELTTQRRRRRVTAMVSLYLLIGPRVKVLSYKLAQGTYARPDSPSGPLLFEAYVLGRVKNLSTRTIRAVDLLFIFHYAKSKDIIQWSRVWPLLPLEPLDTESFIFSVEQSPGDLCTEVTLILAIPRLRP